MKKKMLLISAAQTDGRISSEMIEKVKKSENKNVKIKGDTYSYLWRGEDSTSEPSPKDIAPEDAIHEVIQKLGEVYGFHYKDNYIEVGFNVADFAGLQSSDAYYVFLSAAGDDSDHIYYEGMVNSVMGKLFDLHKYVNGFDNEKSWKKYCGNGTETDQDVEAYKEKALGYLDQYGIYDSKRVNYVSLQQDNNDSDKYYTYIGGESVQFTTDNGQVINVYVGGKTMEFMGFDITK